MKLLVFMWWQLAVVGLAGQEAIEINGRVNR